MTEAAKSGMEPAWDLGPVAAFLSAHSDNAAEAAWVDALPTISEKFAPEIWGESRVALEDWPSATADEWEERGLMPDSGCTRAERRRER